MRIVRSLLRPYIMSHHIWSIHSASIRRIGVSISIGMEGRFPKVRRKWSTWKPASDSTELSNFFICIFLILYFSLFGSTPSSWTLLQFFFRISCFRHSRSFFSRVIHFAIFHSLSHLFLLLSIIILHIFLIACISSHSTSSGCFHHSVILHLIYSLIRIIFFKFGLSISLSLGFELFVTCF